MSNYQMLGAASGREKYLKTYGLGVIRNDSFLPVNEYTDKLVDAHWEKTKKEIGQDFRKYAKTVSDTAKRHLKRLSKKRRYLVTLALEALGFGAKYSGIEGLEEIADELIAGGLIPAVTEIVNSALKGYDRKALRQKYFELMKKLITSDLQPDEKVDVRYLMGVDKFTPKLFGGNGYKTRKLEGKLESMKTYLDRYIEDTDKRKKAENQYELPEAA